MATPFLYQLQNATYRSLTNADFMIGVVDMDDSRLTAGQVSTLTGGQEKVLLTYISIGEAENYRSYWQDARWDGSPPNFLLGENPDWAGNYLVKFWDAAWQKIMFDRVDEAVQLGYSGMYLDIVDAYEVAAVRAAYSGSNDELRNEMVKFILDLSAHAKAQNPDFMVVPQNAVGLLALSQDNPDRGPNTAYLEAIDGLGVEDLWYDDNRSASWTKYDLEYIDLALQAGKFVLATSYPTVDAKKADFIDSAISAGLIPFVADRDLTGAIDPSNNSIAAKLNGKSINFPNPGDGSLPGDDDDLNVGDVGMDLTGSSKADDLTGGSGDDLIRGGGGNDRINGGRGDDDISGGGHSDFILGAGGRDKLFGGTGDDTLKGGGGGDRIYGGAGNDTLMGGAGRDRMIGGAGDDTHTGGRGEDVFLFRGGDGHDLIRDFERGVDRINLSQMDLAGFDELDSNANGKLDKGDIHVGIDGSNTIIDLAEASDAAASSTVTLRFVTGMTESDFLF